MPSSQTWGGQQHLPAPSSLLGAAVQPGWQPWFEEGRQPSWGRIARADPGLESHPTQDTLGACWSG